MTKRDPSSAALAKMLVNARGESGAKALLRELIRDSTGRSLTVIVNKTYHKIPRRYLRGRVYVASEGNLNLSSAKAARVVYNDVLARLVKVLGSENWKTIYLIPTGHPTLSGMVKLAIYQVTRRNTVDLFFANGKYFDLRMSLREDGSDIAKR